MSEESTPATFNLGSLTAADIVLLGAEASRQAGRGGTLEEAAQALVQTLFDSLRSGRGEDRALVLARFYRTIAFEQLEPELREIAARSIPGADLHPWPGLKCLTLMGSAGLEPEWNSRRTSHNHRAIPLTSEEAVQRMPMVATLINQFGLSVAGLVDPQPSSLIDSDVDGNVFHVENAVASPYIPDQAGFVRRYGVRSVVGFGSTLRSGDFWSVILFSRVVVNGEEARLFGLLAPDVKIALLPVLSNRFFAA